MAVLAPFMLAVLTLVAVPRHALAFASLPLAACTQPRGCRPAAEAFGEERKKARGSSSKQKARLQRRVPKKDNAPLPADDNATAAEKDVELEPEVPFLERMGGGWSYASEADEARSPISAQEMDIVVRWMNQYHADVLEQFIRQFTALGTELVRRNEFSGGSMSLSSASLVEVTPTGGMTLACEVSRRRLFGGVKVAQESTELQLKDAKEAIAKTGLATTTLPRFEPGDELTADDWKRMLLAMARVGGHAPATGLMMRMPVADASRALPDDLWLNYVPNSANTRQFFYDGVVDAVEMALRDFDSANLVPRMQIVCKPPELNTAIDTYRVGTLLEMVRDLTTRLACSGLKVRICVQGYLGTGVFAGLPLSLNGVSKIVQVMDWQADRGERFEGMVGEDKFVRFGKIGPDEVADDDGFFIAIAPQNIVGHSIVPLLEAMVEKAAGRPFLLINPRLDDIQSAEGTMSVRGRKERLSFQNSFQTIYEYQCVYQSPNVLYPIVGGLFKAGPREPYVLFSRSESKVTPGSADDNSVPATLRGLKEEYEACASFEERPKDDALPKLVASASAAGACGGPSL